MSLPTYPAYKDSGAEWLGSVPTHWAVGPLKRHFDVCLGKMLQTDSSGESDSLKPYLRAANIQWAGVDTGDIKSMWFSPRDIEQLRLRAGDLLVSEGGDVGRSAVWHNELSECYIQNSVNRIRAKGANSTKFLYYWMATIKAKGYIDVLCNKSTIAHFTAEKVAEVITPFPPPSEQVAIAAFLDRETAKIDALIAEQKNLIALLGEKRQATISHAVTKGLNPNARMKDSGVAWLGEVPAHWIRTPIKHALHAIIDTEHKTAPFYEDGQFLVVRTSNIKDGVLLIDDAKFTDNQGYEEWTKRGKPAPGDIIFTREAPAGEAFVVPDDIPLCLGQRTVLMRTNKSKLRPYYGLCSIYGGLASEFVSLLSQGSTVAHFNMSDIGNIPLLLPPINEQDEIASFLNIKLQKLNTLREECGRTVSLLKERRTALITAAITGQIDVRVAVEETIENAEMIA